MIHVRLVTSAASDATDEGAGAVVAEVVLLAHAQHAEGQFLYINRFLRILLDRLKMRYRDEQE